MIILIVFIIIIYISINLFIKTHGYKIINLVNILNKPYIENKMFYETKDLKWCKKLRNNYKNIRDEYLDYCKNNKLIRYSDIDKVQSVLDNTTQKWYVIILKTFGTYTKNIKYFPTTYKLISQIPGCTLAMFSILEPGKEIPRHSGVYNGVLRYHLGLITDKKDNNKCFIMLNGTKYIWKEGEDVIFDDIYSHYVMNNTKTTRVVLFLDIMKDFNNIFIEYINKILIKLSDYNDTKKEILDNIENK
jgi:beta-hydroxylase